MMSGIRGKDTKPELMVRRFLHGRGFRFRLHDPRLPGRPDIVLPRYRTVVEVRGCFWHQHAGCRFAATPKSNGAFWQRKFQENRDRDARNERLLTDAGWKVLVIWECEVGLPGRMASLERRIRVNRGADGSRRTG
jgi:DNA mismatch endonuclease (patch repair protein)